MKPLLIFLLLCGLTFAQYSPDSYCADAGASDNYACNLSPSPVAYVTGTTYYFKANTANTGAATINFNILGAKTIVKVAGGVPTTLANNDIRVGQVVVVTYDGINMQLQSTLGNAPATGTIAVTTSTLAGDGAGNAIAVTGTATNCVLVNGTSSTCGTSGTAGSPLAVQTSSVTVTSNVESTLIGTVAGSLTIPANWFASNGTVMEVCASGLMTTAAAAQGTVQFKLKFGTTVVAQTAAFTPTASLSNNVYDACIRLTARTVGASGTIMATNIIPTTGVTLISAGEANFTNPTPGTAVVVDTTATQVLDLTVTFSANATNSITQTNFYMVGPGSAPIPSQYKTLSCEPGLGDGLNAMAAGTYLQSTCFNKTGATFTITYIGCFTNNAGSSTLNATNGSATALLTGAITCSSTIASGTQSGTTTIAANDFIKFTFVADGTSLQTTWVVAGTY